MGIHRELGLKGLGVGVLRVVVWVQGQLHQLRRGATTHVMRDATCAGKRATNMDSLTESDLPEPCF